jgi:hypothetical protein
MTDLKHGLTNSEIGNYLKHEKSFLGCFSSDNIPNILEFPCTLIVNSEKSNHPGHHWLAIYLRKDYSLYFDSFGLPVLEEDIFNFLKKYYKKIIYSKQCIQDINSVSCGLFCISFIKHVHSKQSFISFLNNFSLNHLKSNDSKVINLV